MKKKIIIKLCSSMLLLHAINMEAQTSILGNNSFGLPYYIGWSNNVPLFLKTNNDVRMVIGNGSTIPSAGYIGMGNNLGTTFVPTARLHLQNKTI